MKNKTLQLLFIFIILTLYFMESSANTSAIRFPSNKSQIISPDGQYILFCVSDENMSPSHSLFLRRVNSNESVKLYAFSRYVEVLWSPDSKAIIINDYAGSDYSNSIIFILNDSWPSINVREEAKKKNLSAKSSIFRNHHVYIESIKWLDNNSILVKISGYGDIDPDGFTLWYEYILNDGFKPRRVGK